MASKPMTNADRSPVLKAFGQAVRECRSARGFSQEGFAHYCGLDRSYMGGVERGERNLSLYNVWRLANGLGLPVADLVQDLPARKGKR